MPKKVLLSARVRKDVKDKIDELSSLEGKTSSFFVDRELGRVVNDYKVDDSSSVGEFSSADKEKKNTNQ